MNKFLFVFLILTVAVITTAQALIVLEPINEKNVSEIHQVGQLGRGDAYKIAWTPDDETLAPVSPTGIWLFDTDFNQIDY